MWNTNDSSTKLSSCITTTFNDKKQPPSIDWIARLSGWMVFFLLRFKCPYRRGAYFPTIPLWELKYNKVWLPWCFLISSRKLTIETAWTGKTEKITILVVNFLNLLIKVFAYFYSESSELPLHWYLSVLSPSIS